MTGSDARRGSGYCVYLLRCADGSLYAGSTNNIERRLAEHNSGTASRYTRARLPVKLVYRETAPGRGAALRREFQIKKLSRSAKLLLCVSS